VGNRARACITSRPDPTHRPPGALTARLLLALAATALGYLALAGYDAISLAYLDRRLPFRRVVYAAFLGYAFANSLPLSVVTGATVRYRLYSQWGLARSQAARVVTLNTITYAVGGAGRLPPRLFPAAPHAGDGDLGGSGGSWLGWT